MKGCVNSALEFRASIRDYDSSNRALHVILCSRQASCSLLRARMVLRAVLHSLMIGLLLVCRARPD